MFLSNRTYRKIITDINLYKNNVSCYVIFDNYYNNNIAI